jgi:hypothetical protein
MLIVNLLSFLWIYFFILYSCVVAAATKALLVVVVVKTTTTTTTTKKQGTLAKGRGFKLKLFIFQQHFPVQLPCYDF